LPLALVAGDFPNWQTVYTYFRNWRLDGTWVRMHDHLHQWVRLDNDREASPSELIVDSQSVKTAASVSEAVGYDAAKHIKGRKRHLSVDTLGLVLRVLSQPRVSMSVKAASACSKRPDVWAKPSVEFTRLGRWRL
jgi:hypothetical protein